MHYKELPSSISRCEIYLDFEIAMQWYENHRDNSTIICDTVTKWHYLDG